MTLKLKQRLAYGVAAVAVIGAALVLVFTVGGVGGGGPSGPEKLTAEVAGELLVPAFAEATQGKIEIVKVLKCEENAEQPRQFACIATVAGAGVPAESSCGGFQFTVGPDPVRKVVLETAAPIDAAYCGSGSA